VGQIDHGRKIISVELVQGVSESEEISATQQYMDVRGGKKYPKRLTGS
jgi:hypothetical protein